MLARSLAPLLALVALVALAAPASARALGLSPRLGAAMVIEDGPPGTDSTAYGTALSLGLGVGSPLLSVVGDLSFRDASVAAANLEEGWTAYSTQDTLFTLGLRSQLTLLDMFRVAGELHLGKSWADHRAEAEGGVYLFGKPDSYAVYGGAAEAAYMLGKRLSVGLRVGADRFAAMSKTARDEGFDHDRHETAFERTSFTAGLLLGLGM